MGVSLRLFIVKLVQVLDDLHKKAGDLHKYLHNVHILEWGYML